MQTIEQINYRFLTDVLRAHKAQTVQVQSLAAKFGAMPPFQGVSEDDIEECDKVLEAAYQ